MRRVFSPVLAAALVVAGLSVPAAFGHGDDGHGHGPPPKKSPKLLFFVSDGMRQDAVAEVRPRGRHARLREAARPRHARLRQRPAHAGAAEHRRGLVHAVHGRLAGRATARPTTRSTSTAQPFGELHARPSAPACCRPSRSPRPPSAAARRSPRSSTRAAASAVIDGPTLDFRNFRSGRGVATNYVVAGRQPAFTASFGLQYDHPDGSPAPSRPQPAATGWTGVPASYSPAQEMRLRVLDAGNDKYGLNAYIYDSRNDHRTRYDRVLFSPHQGRRRRGRRPRAGRVGRRQGEDRQAPATPERQDRRVPGQGGAARADLSKVRLFHTSVTRAIAIVEQLAGRAGLHRLLRGLRGGEVPVRAVGGLRRARVRDRQRGHLRPAGPLLGEGLPPDHQVRPRDLPAGRGAGRLLGDGRVPAPVPRARDARSCPNGAKNPAYDDVEVNGTPDGRVRAARGLHPHGVRALRRDDAARPAGDARLAA